MATQTSGDLQLSKPAASDLVKDFRTPYNSNMDTIDTAVTALNSNLKTITNAYSLDGASLSALKTSLISKAQSVSVNNICTVTCYPLFTEYPFTIYDTGIGTLRVMVNSSGSLYFGCDFVTYKGKHIVIGYENGTWKIDEVALNSKISSKANVISGNTFGTPFDLSLPTSVDTQLYHIICMTDGNYSDLFAGQVGGWHLFGTNNHGITISSNVITLPTYCLYKIIY